MRKAFLTILVVFVAFTSARQAFSQKNGLFIAPRAGVWTVSAIDEENTKFSARMRLVRRSATRDSVRYSGHFDWIAESGEAGREYFTGVFDRRTGRLRLSGRSVTMKKGDRDFAPGSYSAYLRRGRRIVRGSWLGGVPGKWSADWSRPR